MTQSRLARTTPPSLLVALVVLGAALGWSGVALYEATGNTVMSPPWSASAVLAFFAALLFAGAWYMYDRVHRKKRGVDPLLAVRLLVLGKASALVGALMTGGYIGFAIRFLADYGTSDGRARVIGGFVAAGAALLVLVAAVLLERACKVPKQTNGNKRGDPGNMDEEDEATSTT